MASNSTASLQYVFISLAGGPPTSVKSDALSVPLNYHSEDICPAALLPRSPAPPPPAQGKWCSQGNVSNLHPRIARTSSAATSASAHPFCRLFEVSQDLAAFY